MPLPITRVLAVLDLLQTHTRMNGAELARRVGTDARTVRRYIAILEDLGIPITAERGRYGAYMLVAGFKLPPMMFTNDEAVALSVGMVAARGLGLAQAAPAVESALAKLTRVMPDALKRHVHAIAETVKVNQLPTKSTPASNAALITFTRAAQSQCRVSIGYDSARGAHTQREFDPYGLAWHAGVWYALGMCHLRNGMRTLRLDRVCDVTPLDLHFSRPPDFDALDQLMRGIASIPRAHGIEVVLRTDLDTARRTISLAFALLEPTDDGVTLRSSADDLVWFARQLASLPFDFEIRKPPALRRQLKLHAKRLRALASDGEE